jgi:hypothetical protein
VAIWRKVRAILGMGVTWAIGWVPIAVATVVVLSLINGQWPLGAMVAAVALEGAISGGLGGLLFGSLLALSERRGSRSVGELSAHKVAALGVLSGMIPTGLLVMLLLWRLPVPLDAGRVLIQVLVTCGVIGAASAGGVLYLARRAPPSLGETDRAELSPGRPPPE